METITHRHTERERERERESGSCHTYGRKRSESRVLRGKEVVVCCSVEIVVRRGTKDHENRECETARFSTVLLLLDTARD